MLSKNTAVVAKHSISQQELSQQEATASEYTEKIDKPPIRSKKRKKRKDTSQHIESEIQSSPEVTTSESSSLENYMQLQQTSPECQSPQPTQLELLNENIIKASDPKNTMKEYNFSGESSLSFEVENIPQDIDYEPSESSISEIRNIHKKFKTKLLGLTRQNLSEDTVYPETSTADSEETCSVLPVQRENLEFSGKKKKKRTKSKKQDTSREKQVITPPQLIEETLSPREDESIKTLSDDSNVTVKVVEECFHSIIEEDPKNSIDSVVTFTVPIMEAINTEDNYVQTSPDLMRIETTVQELQSDKEFDERCIQTSPQLLTHSVIQTENELLNEVSTQTKDKEESISVDITVEDVTPVHSVTQTSPRETITDSTQVDGLELYYLTHSFSQTSPTLHIQESKPGVDEVTIEYHEVSTATDTCEPKEDKISQIETDTSDMYSQTLANETKNVETTLIQKTENIPDVQESKTLKSDKSLQTLQKISKEISQQTTPRQYQTDEDTASTSTEEPFEIHLSTKISVPQITEEFIDSERDTTVPKSKKRSRNTKKSIHETELTHTLEPSESLSDPITTELSVSNTPTSGDELTHYTSSVDGIISPRNDDLEYNDLQKPKYSDVVRSKSKSPEEENQNIIDSRRQQLINLIDKRIIKSEKCNKSKPNLLAASIYSPEMEESFEKFIHDNQAKIAEGLKSNNSERVMEHVTIIIETLSTWIDEIQYEIETIKTNAAEDPKQNCTLENSLGRVKSHINELKEMIDMKNLKDDGNLEKIFKVVEDQLNSVEHLHQCIPISKQEAEYSWNSLLNDINALNADVEHLRKNLENTTNSEETILTKLEILDLIDQENCECIKNSRKMQEFARHLNEYGIPRDMPANFYKTVELTKQIEFIVNTERDRLLQIKALAEEYEQTLKDFAQIADVADALLDGKIFVVNLEHLHEEIQKHRKFFVNLSHCRAILESLEENLDSETRLKYSRLHNELHERATVIIDRATSRAQQLTLAASRWSTLEQGMKEEQQWLRVAQQRIPDLANVTSLDHEQYINLYQSVNLDVMHHHAKLQRLLSIAENLKAVVQNTGIDRECTEALAVVMELQEEIEVKLTRLMAFRENWLNYDALIDRVEVWIKNAQREIIQISSDFSTVTAGNMRRFWELKAQHELHNNLKNDSGVQFERALEILPVSDEMVQRQFFSKLEDDWRTLSDQIDNVQRVAIRTISDKDVPFTRKLSILEQELCELSTLVDGLKGTIKNENELHLYIERLQIMNGRVERIQDELCRTSLLSLSPAEKQRLNSLSSTCRNISIQVEEELERSILLKERILSIQASIARVQKDQRRARLSLEDCRASEKLGSDVVERALVECERVEGDLMEQWQALLSVRQALHALPVSGTRASVSPVQLERDISALQDEHARLESECDALANLLRERLALWRRFERQLELVQAAVRETDYMVELLTVQGQVDYDRLIKATEKLEGLSASMSHRSGALVGELRAAAAPLVLACEAGVVSQLQRDLDSAAAAYDRTCANLTHLCDKYQRAVSLWRRYRDAEAAALAWSDAQEAALLTLSPEDAPQHLQACAEQERRAEELRTLAERVASETGSQALRAEAEALGRRLRGVCGALRAMADIGEARQRARERTERAHRQLARISQELPTLEEDGDEDAGETEARLVALRENLLALGRTERDISPATEPDHPDDGPGQGGDVSLLRILQLWQLTFRDTFSQYHRLSSTLVRSEDAATALRLWREYLLDLQSFLSTSIPDDYENLAEHRHLCQVHRDLLAAQRSALLAGGAGRRGDLAAQFATLTELHDETLATIGDRHDRVAARIEAWERYRDAQTRLLRWLKLVEREKEKLRLRYVHMKRIDSVISKIDELREQTRTGRELSEESLGRLKAVLEFSGEAYGAAARVECAGVVKRVDNLEAGLNTWRDFLSRISSLVVEYDHLVGDLQKLYADTQTTVLSYSDDDRISRPNLKTLINKFDELRSAIVKTTSQLEKLSVIQEQLKECLSPQDVRSVNQRVWQLRQQQADLEHQLSIIGHRLQERLDLYSEFESRYSKFDEWLTAIETRFNESNQGSEIGAMDPQDLIRRINSEVQSETVMKEREFTWLVEIGTTLSELSRKDEKKYSENTRSRVQNMQERWNNLLDSSKIRVARISELLETIRQLEERLSQIRIRLHEVDSRITQPIVLEFFTAEEVDQKSSEQDEIQRLIETESGEIGEVLNHCELVFNDVDTLRGNFDIRNLRTGAEIIERKWRGLCEASARRRQTLRDIREVIAVVKDELPDVHRKLGTFEKRIERLHERRNRDKAQDIQDESQKISVELQEMEEAIGRLERAHGDLTRAIGVELRARAADETARLRAAPGRWRAARASLASLHSDAHRRLVELHGQLVVALAQADVRLTRAQHLVDPEDDAAVTLRELQEVEDALSECRPLAEEADRLAATVAASGQTDISDMVDEYRALFADVGERLELARRERGGDVDTAVQVDTLRFETDAALQVDTLTARSAYCHELGSAVRETSAALDLLRAQLARPAPAGASGDELAAEASRLARAGAAPAAPLDLARHLSELLLTECDAGEEEARLADLADLGLQYERLLDQAKKRELHVTNLRLPHSASYALTCEHEAGRLTCPLCSDRNWKQLDNDLWRLEQWLQFAEATDAERRDPPADYETLEDVIQEHREFLLDLDSHKSIVASLNTVGAHVAQHADDARAAAALRARLAADNRRWDDACAAAAAWQRRLQHALLHNQQFHDIVVELVERLGAAERGVRAREPLSLARAADELRRDFRRFSELRDELERTEPRVLALHDAAQLLRGGGGGGDGDGGEGGDQVCRRLTELRLRLQSLRKLAAVYALKLGAALAARARAPGLPGALAAAAAASAAPAQLLDATADDGLTSAALPPHTATGDPAEEEELSGLARGLRFVSRVARASLPFQALLLLLLGAAALAPGGPADSAACRPAGLALEPVLRYPDGPPPM